MVYATETCKLSFLEPLIIRKTVKFTITQFQTNSGAMKTKTSMSLTMLSVFTALAILSPSAIASSSTPLGLTMQGVITNAGNQHYVMSGGALVYGEVGGLPISADSISFSLNSQVTGLKTSGSASISAPGFSANIVINGEEAIQTFPIGSTATSEVPFFFTGVAVMHVQGQTPFKLPIAIESAYWNPFGGPIIITSLDSLTSPALLLVVAYNVATIDWTGVQLQGGVFGTLGATMVSGNYMTVTNSHEDLVNAIEQDSGQIAFFGMSASQLNGHGQLSSTTTFSTDGSISCDVLTGFPGTCLFTGASSLGAFNMVGQHGLKISGTFGTQWSVPSLSTLTTASATVTSP